MVNVFFTVRNHSLSAISSPSPNPHANTSPIPNVGTVKGTFIG